MPDSHPLAPLASVMLSFLLVRSPSYAHPRTLTLVRSPSYAHIPPSYVLHSPPSSPSSPLHPPLPPPPAARAPAPSQTREASSQSKRAPPYESSDRLVFKNIVSPSGLGASGIDTLRGQTWRGDMYQSTQRDFSSAALSKPSAEAALREGAVHVAPTGGTLRAGYGLQVSNSHGRLFG